MRCGGIREWGGGFSGEKILSCCWSELGHEAIQMLVAKTQSCVQPLILVTSRRIYPRQPVTTLFPTQARALRCVPSQSQASQAGHAPLHRIRTAHRTLLLRNRTWKPAQSMDERDAPVRRSTKYLLRMTSHSNHSPPTPVTPGSGSTRKKPGMKSYLGLEPFLRTKPSVAVAVDLFSSTSFTCSHAHTFAHTAVQACYSDLHGRPVPKMPEFLFTSALCPIAVNIQTISGVFWLYKRAGEARPWKSH